MLKKAQNQLHELLFFGCNSISSTNNVLQSACLWVSFVKDQISKGGTTLLHYQFKLSNGGKGLAKVLTKTMGLHDRWKIKQWRKHYHYSYVNEGNGLTKAGDKPVSVHIPTAHDQTTILNLMSIELVIYNR